MVELVIFYAFAALILLSAVLMTTSRNIFHSALYLALCLFGVAAIFVLLNSYFLAGIQVLIYIGAVVILTIFVINLTREITGKLIPQTNKQVIPAILASLLTAGLIILTVLKTGWGARLGQSVAKMSNTDNVGLIGRQFLTDFVLPFEIASVLLLAALIGAVVIVSKDEEAEK
jgi:NADH:ubiquinone oxidoreductase subunit 6 (subunit J)